MNWLKYYVDDLEYEQIELKQSYDRLTDNLNNVVTYEKCMEENPSNYFWTASYFSEVAGAVYEIDHIQSTLKYLDNLRNRIKAEMEKKTLSE